MTPRPTICLNMIVRNEAHVVAETLTSVVPFIDSWIVVDTGSVDGTQEVIRRFFAERSVPGELHERPWRDFGTNRTEALALCEGRADYAWVIDADDLVVGNLDLGHLTADAYQLRYGNEFTYWRTQLFRLDHRWRYVGAVHEYPTCDELELDEQRVEGRYHVESRRLGDRNRAADKYARDAEVLEAAVALDPHDARSVFYLAQSLLDGDDPEGALTWYGRRAEMGGWSEEVFYSLLQRARCLERLDRPWAEVLEAYLTSWRARPTRAEPLYEIARHYRLAGHHALGYLFAKAAAGIPYPESDVLFVAADVYRWRSVDEQAVTAHYLERYRDAMDSCTSLLNTTALPESERCRVADNRAFAVAELADTFLEYPVSAIGGIDAHAQHPARTDLVTLTITTCKRPDLFERTINSFLHCCQDVERIDRWICIDDGSSAADRARMRELYPFFEFVWRPAAGRGHAASMNELVGLVDTPYWLHLEDDWQFVIADQYVTRGMAILDEDPSIGQVLFNANYAETEADRDSPGGSIAATQQGIRYRVHQYLDPAGDDYQRFFDALPPGTVAHVWWPHFSLRPSLLRADAVRELGGFDATADHFELDFARRYADRGYRSAFFDSIHCLHIGTLTTEHGSSRRPNVYELNQTPQFGGRPASTEPALAVGAVEDLDVRVINLDRRPDRWEAFLSSASSAGGEAFARARGATRLSTAPHSG